MREAMLDKEASLRRAKLEASDAEGISWGMGEDAIEEDEVMTHKIIYIVLPLNYLITHLSFICLNRIYLNVKTQVDHFLSSGCRMMLKK